LFLVKLQTQVPLHLLHKFQGQYQHKQGQDHFVESELQLWGNPLYNWDKMEADDFKWWRSRFSSLFEIMDIVRIDHFRGFEAFWEIKGDAKTAENLGCHFSVLRCGDREWLKRLGCLQATNHRGQLDGLRTRANDDCDGFFG
jgi:hypothetical protein